MASNISLRKSQTIIDHTALKKSVDQEQNFQMGAFEVISNETIQHVFLQLPPKEICRISRVCRAWYSLIYDNTFWKQVCIKRWENLTPSPVIEGLALKVFGKNEPDQLKQPFSQQGETDWLAYYFYKDHFQEILPALEQSRLQICESTEIGKKVRLVQLADPLTDDVTATSIMRALITIKNITEMQYFNINTSTPLSAQLGKVIDFVVETCNPIIFHEYITSEANQVLTECFFDLGVSDFDPKVLNNKLEGIINRFIEYIKKNPSSDVVQSITTMIESASKQMKKKPALLTLVIETLMSIITTVEEDRAYSLHDEPEEGKDKEIYFEVCGSIDRISMEIKGKTIYPIALKLIMKYMTSSDWRYRYTSMIAMTFFAESCRSQINAQMNMIVPNVLKMINDQHPAVVWSALNALGQMSTDLAPEIQDKFIDKMFPIVINALSSNNDKVQAHAASCLINIVEECDKKMLEPYFSDTIESLIKLFNDNQPNDDRFQQSTSAISALLITMKGDSYLNKYYDRIAPKCISILSNIQNHGSESESKLDDHLIGTLIESLGIIAYSVPDKSKSDIDKIIDLIIKKDYRSSNIASYYLAATTRIVKLLDNDIDPYLDIIISNCLHFASLTPVTLPDDDNDDNDDDDDDDDEESRFRFSSDELEKKKEALDALESITERNITKMSEYIDQIVPVMVDVLEQQSGYDVKCPDSAINILIHLLKHGADPNDFIHSILSYINDLVDDSSYEGILDAMEDLTSTYMKYIQALENIASYFATTFGQSFNYIYDFYENAIQGINSGESDPEDCDIDHLATLFQKICSVLSNCFVEFGAEFYKRLPSTCKESIFTILQKLDHDLLLGAIIFIDDVIEHVPNSIEKSTERKLVMDNILKNVDSDDTSISHCCAYGIGVVSCHWPDYFKPFIDESFQKVKSIIDGNPDIDVGLRDNCIASLIRIAAECTTTPPNVALSILQYSVPKLPLKEDKSEMKRVTKMLLNSLPRLPKELTELREQIRSYLLLEKERLESIDKELADSISTQLN